MSKPKFNRQTKWMVYFGSGELAARVKYCDIAIQLAESLGAGTTIRRGHNKADIVWTIGKDPFKCTFDEAYKIIQARIEDQRLSRAKKWRSKYRTTPGPDELPGDDLK